MIRLQRFSYNGFQIKNSDHEVEEFLNQVGQENIIYFKCFGHPNTPLTYIIVYNDGT